MLNISLAMIVKNEENRIRRAIAGARECVKEIIVVDTGSTDRTRDVSREAGATVLDYPFNGDFSAARNFSLTACTGEWILVLDADEAAGVGGVVGDETVAEIEDVHGRSPVPGNPEPQGAEILLRPCVGA